MWRRACPGRFVWLTVLRSVQWTLVTTDHWKTPIVGTALYVRLHGAAGPYVGDYGPVALQHWADLTARFLAVDTFMILV